MLRLPLLSQQPTQRMRNRPLKEAPVHSQQSPSPSPPSAGHLPMTMCGPIVSAQEGTYGSLGFKWMFMSLVWQPKGRPYPKFYSLSLVCLWLCVLALTCAQIWGLSLSLCVSGSVLYLTLHVFITRDWKIALKAARAKFFVYVLCVCVCLTQPKDHIEFSLSFKLTVTYFIVPGPQCWLAFIILNI